MAPRSSLHVPSVPGGTDNPDSSVWTMVETYRGTPIWLYLPNGMLAAQLISGQQITHRDIRKIRAAIDAARPTKRVEFVQLTDFEARQTRYGYLSRAFGLDNQIRTRPYTILDAERDPRRADGALVMAAEPRGSYWKSESPKPETGWHVPAGAVFVAPDHPVLKQIEDLRAELEQVIKTFNERYNALLRDAENVCRTNDELLAAYQAAEPTPQEK